MNEVFADLDPTPARLQLSTEHYSALAASEPQIPTIARALSVSANGQKVAFTGQFGHDGASRAVVADLASGAMHSASSDEQSALPIWAPDGDRLAWIINGDEPVVMVRDSGEAFAGTRYPLPPGSVESLSWSPAATQLLVGMADFGATLSDAFGSGRIPGRPVEKDESWRPTLSPQQDGDGRRHAYVLDLATSSLQDLLPGKSVWQACWRGNAEVVCIASEDPDESGWYQADLVCVDLATGRVARLPRPAGQLARPSADPVGQDLAIIAGRMSDRGLDSGELMVLTRGAGTWSRVNTDGVDVSHLQWTEPGLLQYCGLRSLTTVIAEVDLGRGISTILWESEETCGDPVPEFAQAAGTTAIVMNGYHTPPAIAVLADGRADVRCDLRGPRADEVIARAGRLHHVSWTSSDDVRIDGFLTLPPGDGPFPLVVEIHGGPVWAWRNAWLTDDHLTPLLVAAGYAVLHPNIRGSSGRGQEFVRLGLDDMCGARDVPDLVRGVEHVIALGIADPQRIAISGLSYGGLMAAWMVTQTDVFAASVSRSPVTDWVSQHYASNLPGFDEIVVAGDPLDPESAYRKQSPLYHVASASTPVLLVAGGQDLATPPEQAAMFHRALREHGVASELVIYPEEGHGVHDHRALVDHGGRVLDFLDRHLGLATTA